MQDKAKEYQTWLESNNMAHLPSVDLGTKHHFGAGVYAKEMRLPKGATALSHRHAYDHLSVLAQGVAVVNVDGTATLYTAPTCITIKAGLNHEIVAIEPVVWFCIHATEETDKDKIDEVILQP